MSASDAYRATYGTRGAKNVNDISSRLSAKVSNRVQELQRASDTEKTLSRSERRELLAERARRENVEDRDLVALLHLDAKLAGELEDNVKHSGLIEHRHVLSEADRQTLVAKKRKAMDARRLRFTASKS